jgi:hypothetical protein
MKPPAEIIVTIIVVVIIMWYAVMAGTTAGWYSRMYDNPRESAVVVVGTLWPVSAPVLLSVHVYRKMMAKL